MLDKEDCKNWLYKLIGEENKNIDNIVNVVPDDEFSMFSLSVYALNKIDSPSTKLLLTEYLPENYDDLIQAISNLEKQHATKNIPNKDNVSLTKRITANYL